MIADESSIQLLKDKPRRRSSFTEAHMENSTFALQMRLRAKSNFKRKPLDKIVDQMEAVFELMDLFEDTSVESIA